MARFRYSPGPRILGLLIIGLLLIIADVALRVWVPPAQAPEAGDQTEKALSQAPMPEARLAPPFDPFYEDVATLAGQESGEPDASEDNQETGKVTFDYRVLAVSEAENGRFRAVIRMTRSEGKSTKPKQNIETLVEGDAIGDARITGISEREVRLQSESLGALTLTLFLPSRTVPENGTESAEL